MKLLNFLHVEDDILLREGVRSLLEKEKFTKAVFGAANKGEFVTALKTQEIDMIILDFRLADTNGLDLLLLVKEIKPELKVIVVTGLEGTEMIINLLKAGVHGVAFKLDGYKELVKTIEEVITIGSYFPDRILKIIQQNVSRWDEIPTVQLTFHELELLKAIASGLTTKSIASLLKMKEATTETYRIRLIKKMGVSNTAELLAYAYRNGIL